MRLKVFQKTLGMKLYREFRDVVKHASAHVRRGDLSLTATVRKCPTASYAMTEVIWWAPTEKGYDYWLEKHNDVKLTEESPPAKYVNPNNL